MITIPIREYVAKLPKGYRQRCISEWLYFEEQGTIPENAFLRRAAEELASTIAPYPNVVTTMRDIIFEIYRAYAHEFLGLR